MAVFGIAGLQQCKPKIVVRVRVFGLRFHHVRNAASASSTLPIRCSSKPSSALRIDQIRIQLHCDMQVRGVRRHGIALVAERLPK